MINKIQYKNFKALVDTTLELGQFSLIIGANGTGKTTAINALEIVNSCNTHRWRDLVSATASEKAKDVSIKITTSTNNFWFLWSKESGEGKEIRNEKDDSPFGQQLERIQYEELENFRIFAFDPKKISSRVTIDANTKLSSDGGNLAGILDFLRDTEPERWKSLNDELAKWFPEFDQILFDRHDNGKSIVLRTKVGKHKIKAADLSEGTILALAYLTVAYLPAPPKTVCFEEPERGIHPRLLRNIQDAMYHLAYPKDFNDERNPIQVIAISHSPYLLDLYKEHPDEIIISSKDHNGVHFERLIESPHLKEILQDAPLGEVWYTGVLGGVPAHI
jgi:predicted ATPase